MSGRGYPGSAAAAASAGFRGGGAGVAAGMSGARAAALLARGIPYVGTAVLAAELLHMLLVKAMQPAIPAGYSVPVGWTLCPRPTGCDTSGWTIRDRQMRFTASPSICANTNTCGGGATGTPWGGASAVFIPGTHHNAREWVQLNNASGMPDPRWWYQKQWASGGATIATAPAWQDAVPAQPPRWLPPPPIPAPSSWADRRPRPVDAAAAKATGVRSGGNSVPGVVVWGVAPGVTPISRPGGRIIAQEGARPGVVPIPGLPGVGVVITPGVGVGVELGVDRRPRVVPVINAAVPARAVTPNRELKARVFPMLQGLMAGYNAATEVGDLVGALHKALPPCRRTKSEKMLRQARAARQNGWNKKYKRADISSYQKLRDVSSYLNDLARDPGMQVRDLPKRCANAMMKNGANGRTPLVAQYANDALLEVTKEEFKDRLYGRLGKELGAVSRQLGLPVGLQSMRRASETAVQTWR